MNNKRLFILAIFSLSLFLNGCATAPQKQISAQDWRDATKQVVQQYGPKANAELGAYFEAAHAQFPPKKIALLAFKKERKIELWAQSKGSWKFIHNYPLTAFSGGPGPKLQYHDGQIPEGIYQITELNPFSSVHLSMELDYPNAFDKAHAKHDGRTNLGNLIFIHGKALSVGCLAIGDPAIDQLFVLVDQVGRKNTEVIIAPNDLRYEAPVTNLAKQPKWVPRLYRKIKAKLRPFTV